MIQRKIKNNIYLIPICCLIIIFNFLSCEGQKFDPLKKQQVQEEKYSGPSSVHYNFSQYVYDDKTHKPKVIIKGKIARFFKQKGRVELVNVTVLYQKPDNKEDSKKQSNKNEDKKKIKLTQLTCEEMTIYESKKLYEGRGNVVIISKNGVRLETEKIYFDEKNEKLYTEKDEKVNIYHKNGVITRGYYLRSDIGLNKIMLDRQKTVAPEDDKQKKKHGV